MALVNSNNMWLSIFIACLMMSGLLVPNEGLAQNNAILTNTAAINTEGLEFSPCFYQNGIVFTTARRAAGPRDNNIEETFFELFFAEFDGNGLPIEGEDFGVEMNSEVHEGPVSFSKDGNTIFLTRNNYTKGIKKVGADGKVHMKVYEAKRGFFDWENIKELPFNNDDYDVMHPTLSPDGTTLYFTSNMPGGHGETDIYMVSRNGDSWGTPVNLGAEVNTAGKEAFPFIHESGALFFASTKHKSKGGFDIFKASSTGTDWGNVISMGSPFNTSKDDFGLILNSDGQTGYFTSDRADGNGKDDIYKFELTDELIEAPEMLSSIIKVYDAQTNMRIKDAEIRVFEQGANGLIAGGDLYDAVLMPERAGSNELVLKLVRKNASQLGTPDLLSDKNGEAPYSLGSNKQYIVLVSKDGYMSNEVVYSTAGKSGELLIEVPLDTKRCANLSGIVTNSSTGAIISNAVVRITSTCDGEEQVTKSDKNGLYEYCMPPGCNYTIRGEKSGYSSGIGNVNVPASPSGGYTSNLALTPSTPSGPVVSNPFSAGTVIVLDKIYYDFNKSAIRTGAARELDEVVSIMQRYPSMEIELVSHTDSRGGTDYNQVLSLRRAESAKRYLVSRGVRASRVTALGYGETQPRNQCRDGVNCSEEEHQYNRRTEMRVIRIDEPVQVQYGDKGPERIDRRGGN